MAMEKTSMYGILSTEVLNGMKRDLTPLGQYIDSLCREQRVSYREGSRMAGLDETTISQILRRGKTSTPRPDTLKLIANALGGNYEYMLQLAGHLDERPPEDDPDIRRTVLEVTSIWRRLKEADPEAARRLMRIAIIQAQAFEAAVTAGRQLVENEMAD